MAARFGCFEIDVQRRQLTAAGKPLHLTPKAFDLLWMLVEAAPRVVPKREIHERLWHGGVVSDATLVGLVKEIRRAMGEGTTPSPVRTVHRIGYALDLPVMRAAEVEAVEGQWVVCGSRLIALAAGENVIGRDPTVAVWMDHTTLSRRHARITLTDGRAVLEDLGSKNGTRLKGVSVVAPTPLQGGDKFTCGQLPFHYLDTATAPATETQVYSGDAKLS